MKIFQCENCHHPIYFENTRCEKCGSALGYLQEKTKLITLTQSGDHWTALGSGDQAYLYCSNFSQGVCNWMVPADGNQDLCLACELNRTIPNLSNPTHFEAWQKLEIAKHRLLYSMLRLGLPVRNRTQDPDGGLCFDFVSSYDATPPHATSTHTGHERGVITINLAEADPVQREQFRRQLGERYRTLIGHFRHEVGHYYWERLVQPDEMLLRNYRKLFGNEQASYEESLKLYYQNGPTPGWQSQFLTAYAASHPWEDWAECWAHYFHLVDTLETAHAFGISLSPNLVEEPSLNMHANFDPYEERDFDRILKACIPLTFAMNSLNRGMGQPDAYPFVQPPPVVNKLRFIHEIVQGVRSKSSGLEKKPSAKTGFWPKWTGRFN